MISSPRSRCGCDLLLGGWLLIAAFMPLGCTPNPTDATNGNAAASPNSASPANNNASSSNASSNNTASNNAAKDAGTGARVQGSTTGNAKTPFQFVTHGADLGVDFRYQNGESAWLVAMIESNGGGVAFLDYDRDGRWDLFFPGGGRLTSEKNPIMVENGLFRQATPMRFENRAGRAGCAPGVCYSFGAAAGDFDADGLTDLFITGYNGQQLLRNMGDGTFEDCTQTAGFHHRGWSSSAAWFDLENDGDLDLYIAHYGVWSPALEKQCLNSQGEIDRCAPADFVGEPDELWINEGDGTFRDQSEVLKTFAYRGIGVVACDFDHDGDTDLYVSNDEDPKTFFENAGNGELVECGAKSGTSLGSRNIVDGSMGLAVGDFDGNRKPDVLVTNYQNEYCELYLNQGNLYFSLGTRSAGLMALGQAVVGWGTAFADLDLDRDEDLIVIAGHTARRPIKSSTLQKPYLLENNNGKRLTSVGESSGEFFREVHAGRGMAIGDIDDDGDIDFVVSKLEQPVSIVTNESRRLGHSLAIDLVGTQSNRNAIGAWLEIDFGNETRIKHHFGGGSYASTHASTLHIGLGDVTRVPAITVHWPSGATQVLKELDADRRYRIVEGMPLEIEPQP